MLEMVLVDSEHEMQTFSLKTVPAEGEDIEQVGDAVQVRDRKY